LSGSVSPSRRINFRSKIIGIVLVVFGMQFSPESALTTGDVVPRLTCEKVRRASRFLNDSNASSTGDIETLAEACFASHA
jgi:hypothetical protein